MIPNAHDVVVVRERDVRALGDDRPPRVGRRKRERRDRRKRRECAILLPFPAHRTRRSRGCESQSRGSRADRCRGPSRSRAGSASRAASSLRARRSGCRSSGRAMRPRCRNGGEPITSVCLSPSKSPARSVDTFVETPGSTLANVPAGMRQMPSALQLEPGAHCGGFVGSRLQRKWHACAASAVGAPHVVGGSVAVLVRRRRRRCRRCRPRRVERRAVEEHCRDGQKEGCRAHLIFVVEAIVVFVNRRGSMRGRDRRCRRCLVEADGEERALGRRDREVLRLVALRRRTRASPACLSAA